MAPLSLLSGARKGGVNAQEGCSQSRGAGRTDPSVCSVAISQRDGRRVRMILLLA